MFRSIILTLAAVTASMPCFAQEDGTCKDEYEVIFGIKPLGERLWISPPDSFKVRFPATMSTSAGPASLEAHVVRADARHILVTYTFDSPAKGRQAALVRIELGEADLKPFHGSTTDPAGNTWSFSARSLCNAV
jgi:hypothetical protein